MPGTVEPERLQKYLSALGIGSRRKIEQWIVQGKISVDGKVAQLGDRVVSGCRVSIDGKPLRLQSGKNQKIQRRLLLYNKPEGEICTRSDPRNRPTVFQNLPEIRGKRWVAVGRLDINTRGIMLFTDDGGLANHLMHPRLELEREYLCRILGEVAREGIEKLKSGIEIDGALVRFHQVRALRRQTGEHTNTWYSVTVTDGKYRAVRRMWQAIGCRVNRLNRIRYGKIALPRGLKSGDWMELSPADITLIAGNHEKGKVVVPRVPKKGKHKLRRR